jgi:translation elongation factor TU
VDVLEQDMEAMRMDDVEPIPTTTHHKQWTLHDIQQHMRTEADGKEHLNLVIVGHVDAGKSTLVGHLLYLLGKVDDRTMKKFERESQKMGKGSFAYAWVLDATAEERARGITMDIAENRFETTQRRFTILDAPGHKDFVPQMISGATQADVAILVVDATTGEFEAGFQANGQTKEHTLLVRSLGVSQIVVAINKLDNAQWSKDRYAYIRDELAPFLHHVGFHKHNIFFVPCSGLTGQNLLKRDAVDAFSWYTGPTLVEQIDELDVPRRSIEKPLRFTVNDVFKGGFSGGICLNGRIEDGYVTEGQSILVMPLKLPALVKAIDVDEERKQWAIAGSTAVLTVLGDATQLAQVRPGAMVCTPDHPIPVSTRFIAQIVTFDIHIPITAGYQCILFYNHLHVPTTAVKLLSLQDRATGEIIKPHPRVVPKSSTATIEFKTEHAICMEAFKDAKNLGRITLRKNGDTIGAGIVLNVL